MKLFSYRYLSVSKTLSVSNRINLVKRFHVISKNYPIKPGLCENYGLFHNRHTNISNTCYVQKLSLHSFFEGYVAAFQSLSESSAVVTSQDFLTNVHDFTGLPWWATVAVSTVLLRTVVTMPLALYQQNILAKVENLKSELSPLVKELQNEVTVASKMYNWSQPKATSVYQRSLKKQWNILIERDNCHPAKAGILVLFQLPMWVLLSMAIRNLVSMRPFGDQAAIEIFNEMKNEGFLWIPDLTVPDDTMITSTLLCLVSLSIIEVNRLMMVRDLTRLQKTVLNISRVLALITFPFALIVPSCLSFYWLTSATFGLIQNLIVMSPRLKLLVGIPRTPSTLEKPYSHLWQQLKSRMKIVPKM